MNDIYRKNNGINKYIDMAQGNGVNPTPDKIARCEYLNGLDDYVQENDNSFDGARCPFKEEIESYRIFDILNPSGYTKEQLVKEEDISQKNIVLNIENIYDKTVEGDPVFYNGNIFGLSFVFIGNGSIKEIKLLDSGTNNPIECSQGKLNYPLPRKKWDEFYKKCIEGGFESSFFRYNFVAYPYYNDNVRKFIYCMEPDSEFIIPSSGKPSSILEKLRNTSDASMVIDKMTRLRVKLEIDADFIDSGLAYTAVFSNSSGLQKECSVTESENNEAKNTIHIDFKISEWKEIYEAFEKNDVVSFNVSNENVGGAENFKMNKSAFNDLMEGRNTGTTAYRETEPPVNPGIEYAPINIRTKYISRAGNIFNAKLWNINYVIEGGKSNFNLDNSNGVRPIVPGNEVIEYGCIDKRYLGNKKNISISIESNGYDTEGMNPMLVYQGVSHKLTKNYGRYFEKSGILVDVPNNYGGYIDFIIEV